MMRSVFSAVFSPEKMKSWVFVVLSFFVFELRLYAEAPSRREMTSSFVLATQNLSENKLDESILVYQKLLTEHGGSGIIHYNLGIAYFRKNEFGRSIFHFLEARRRMPRDGDTKFNLAYARKKPLDKIEDKRSFVLVFAEKLMFFSQFESYVLLLSSVFVTTFFALLLFKVKSDWLRWGVRVGGGLVFLSCALVGISYLNNQNIGVVVTTTAPIYSGNSEQNVQLFTLHEGAEFYVDEQRGEEWLRIHLVDGKKGWINSEFVQIF